MASNHGRTFLAPACHIEFDFVSHIHSHIHTWLFSDGARILSSRLELLIHNLKATLTKQLFELQSHVADSLPSALASSTGDSGSSGGALPSVASHWDQENDGTDLHTPRYSLLKWDVQSEKISSLRTAMD